MKIKVPIQMTNNSFSPNFYMSANVKTDVDTGTSMISLDKTLTKENWAADAKAVGDGLAQKQDKGNYIVRDELADWAKEEKKPEYDYTEIKGLQEQFETFVFKQLTPSNNWKIEHNLNRYPSVTIENSAGDEVMGEITYIDKNTIILTFTGSFSGRAYLN